MAFITLLATAVGILAVLGLLLTGLVEAPWQILLLGLLVALYGLQRQSWASQLVAQARDAEANRATAPERTSNSAASKPE